MTMWCCDAVMMRLSPEHGELHSKVEPGAMTLKSKFSQKLAEVSKAVSGAAYTVTWHLKEVVAMTCKGGGMCAT